MNEEKPLSPESAFVPQTYPPAVEVGEIELTEADKEALAKAEAKRARKAKKAT